MFNTYFFRILILTLIFGMILMNNGLTLCQENIVFEINISEPFSSLNSDVNIGEWSPRRSRGDYSPIFTSPEATNCFSIITLMIIRENKKIWLPF